MKKAMLIGKIILGNFIMACAVNAFVIPFGFISGGTTGLSLVIYHYTRLPFSVITMMITFLCFILGLIFLGKKFAATTLLSTLIYPVFIQLTQFLNEASFVNEPILAAIFAGVMMGFSLGLVIESGASTGGLEIPSLILHDRFGFNISLCLYVTDTILLFMQLPFSNLNGIFMGVVFIALTSFTMNQTLTFGKSSVQLMIFTEKYEEIRQVFIRDLDKGCTLFMVETGYLQRKEKAVCSIAHRKDIFEIRKAVEQADPKAFMVVSSVKEVRGIGFEKW